MSVDTHENGMIIIPDQATIWAHLLNENYTRLVLASRMALGDDRYFRQADYEDVSERPWFLGFRAEPDYRDDNSLVLSSLQKNGVEDMDYPSWFRTTSSDAWLTPLVIEDGLLQGDIYYTNAYQFGDVQETVVSENTYYANLTAGSPSTQKVSIPWVTYGSSLKIIGAASNGTDHILIGSAVSSTGIISTTVLGANIQVSPTPLTGNETSPTDTLLVYLGATELELSYTGPLSKVFAVSYNTTTNPS